jgi:predicted RND superfamily exporter protein
MLSLLTNFSSKVYLIVIAALVVITLVLGGASYLLFNKTIKKEIENQKLSTDILNMEKEHTNTLVILSEKMREQEIQKNDLISHAKLLQKKIKRKSSVNTKAKDFKSRRITKFRF